MAEQKTARLRCREHLRGRRVKHPAEDRLIEVGDVVELPEVLAAYLLDRGDFEPVAKSEEG